MKVRNPFRERGMRLAFDDCVRCYEARGKNLFHNGTTPHRGNGLAMMFWRGYEGTNIGQWDAASKRLVSYAYWKAGAAIKAAEIAKPPPAEGR